MEAIGVLFGLAALAGTVVWIWALVDCITRQFTDSTTKLIWVLVILFTHALGAIIYLAVGRQQGFRR